MVTRVALLGSTGSIGTQALDIIAANSDRFSVAALAAGGGNPDQLIQQVQTFAPELVAVANADAADAVRQACPDVEVMDGPQAAVEAAAMGADIVLNGMTGSVGLQPTLAALAAGSRLALANKESLVVGGVLVTQAAADDQVVPVDSEHSALAQCLRSGTHNEVKRLVLTASGGPFRGWSADQLEDVTPEQALAHPTWNMGPVVTINSATLVNKGLEIIEAHLLFDIGYDRIEAVVHPQSVVHSMVEFVDGSTIAQASPPDMHLPIALGLGWPDRIADSSPPCDWTQAATWEFFPLDTAAFPAVRIAREVGQAAGTAPAVFNASNEECVAGFLAGQIGFSSILRTVETIVDEHRGSGFVPDASLSVSDVLAAEQWARARTHEILNRG